MLLVHQDRALLIHMNHGEIPRKNNMNCEIRLKLPERKYLGKFRSNLGKYGKNIEEFSQT